MRRIGFAKASAIVAFVALGACAGARVTVPPLQPEEVASLRASSSYPDGAYRLEPGDMVRIRYEFHPEMDQQQVVRPDGKIRASGIGEIPAAGLTTDQLEDVLVQRTSATLRDPEVVVSVAEFAPKTVFVAGEVATPGPINFRKGLTPLQAISEAGGFRDTARIEQVVLMRAVNANGETVSRTIDLEAVLEDGEAEPIDLAPHDVVYVPRTNVAEANIWVDQHFTQLFPFFKGAGGKVAVGGQ